MADRVEFTDNGGSVKNMEKPLAMRLQHRKLGKITKVISGNSNTAKSVAQTEEALLNAEIKIEELENKLKALKKPKNKVEKDTKNLETK
jgi:hypothetical protein